MLPASIMQHPRFESSSGGLGPVDVVVGDISQENEYKRPPLDAFFDKTVYIRPLTIQLAKKVLEVRLKNVKIISKTELFTDELIQSLVNSSRGNVREFLRETRDVLERAAQTNWSKDQIDVDIMDYLKRDSVHNTKTIGELSEREREILRYVKSDGPLSASDNTFQTVYGCPKISSSSAS